MRSDLKRRLAPVHVRHEQTHTVWYGPVGGPSSWAYPAYLEGEVLKDLVNDKVLAIRRRFQWVLEWDGGTVVPVRPHHPGRYDHIVGHGAPAIITLEKGQYW